MSESIQVGQTVGVQVNRMTFLCRVLEIRRAYGRTRYKIAPLSGDGSSIVENVVLVNANV